MVLQSSYPLLFRLGLDSSEQKSVQEILATSNDFRTSNFDPVKVIRNPGMYTSTSTTLPKPK